MKIHVASLALRFYKFDGWTETRVRKYLINRNLKITYIPDLKYWAVYALKPNNLKPNKSDRKIFRESIRENEFVFMPPPIKGGEEDWYIE